MASPWATEKQLFRALLRQTRESKGLTQVQLAARLGKPQSYVSKIESGDRSMDLIEVRAYCVACDVVFIDFVRTLESNLLSQIGRWPVD